MTCLAVNIIVAPITYLVITKIDSQKSEKIRQIRLGNRFVEERIRVRDE